MTTSHHTERERRIGFTSQRIIDLRSAVSAVTEISKYDQLCVYATGSYARGEASPSSDLDLFFLAGDRKQQQDPEQMAALAIAELDKNCIMADIIRFCRLNDYPEFSRDGGFLVTHYLDEMRESFGGPTEDYFNHFTARMLLLLESLPVHNDHTYHKHKAEVLSWYYKDYRDHKTEFLPVFFANDVIRFWKTLCLNYENYRADTERSNNESRRLKGKLKNLKLKFSRLLTCFSTILLIVAQEEVVSEGLLMNILNLTPTERLIELPKRSTLVSVNDIDESISLYEQFLTFTSPPRDDVLTNLHDRAQEDEIFKSAKLFGDSIYSMILKLARHKEWPRYLVI